jgi:hypothetical protein
LTNFVLAERRPLEGQRPRHLWVPDYVDDSHGHDAIELAESVGLKPDGWQRDVTIVLLAVRADGNWAAFEFGLEVPRQNGKGGCYEIRELYGLFVLREKLLIHSAHEYKTAEQALDRMEALIDGSDDLRREVKSIKRSHGQEGIYLKTGQVLRYFTRTASGGRGFSCDFLGLDEAMKIKHSMHAAMFPTMSARPNPQILYAGSAVDQETMDDGIVFARVRERGIEGGDPRLAFFGYSAPFDHPDEVTPADAVDLAHWAAANPALGIRITPEYIEMEQRALSARGFAVERLSVGDWPDTSETAERRIDPEKWAETFDPYSRDNGRVALAFDVDPDRAWASIGSVGQRADGKWHGELLERRPGTDWVLDRLADLAKTGKPLAVLYQAGSQAASLVAEAKNLKIRRLEAVSLGEVAEACGMLFDAIDQGTFKRGRSAALDAAVDGAEDKRRVDAWVWDRRDSTADITPLMVVTIALWAAMSRKKKRAGVVDLAAALAEAEAAEQS